MIAQITLLREILSQFAGSELYIGLIIGNWVAAEALGAFAAVRFSKEPVRCFSRFIAVTILLSLLFPVMLFLARTWRYTASLPLHEAFSLWQILAASVILIFPLAIIQGTQFVLAVTLYANITGKTADAPGKAYGIETVGTVIGGTAASFLLVPLLSPFQTAAILLIVNGLIVIFLQRVMPQTAKRSGRIMLALPLLASLLLLFGGARFLDNVSLRLQWNGETLVAAKNSLYQNIAVVRSGEQHTFYADGVPLLSLPYPDIGRLEESVHLPLLTHPVPRKVLLIGSGAGAAIGEIFKHPTVERIDYVELDPALIETIEKYSPESLLRELRDPRVHLHIKDGRSFLRDTAARYDVVLIEMPLPLNLQGNRYFTAEFFAAVRRVLLPDGVAAFGATGSMSYYGEDLKEVTRSLVRTVRAVFPHLLVVPGERNLFIVSPGTPVEKLTAEDLTRRFEARKLKTALISTPHLQWILSDSPLKWFKESIGDGGVVNSDFSPYILTRHMSYMTTSLNPEIKPLLEMLGRLKSVHVAVTVILATLVIALVARNSSKVAVSWAIATTGFTAMLLELAFFCMFQLSQGVMLRTIGLLIAIFMAGLWGGSRISATPSVSTGGDRKHLLAGEAILLLLCGGLWAISSGEYLSASASAALPYMILLPMIFFAGFAVGIQFPPGARMTADHAGPGTSIVYGFDLLGGWLGGVVGGALLLPLLGFANVATLLCILKSGSILCLYLQRKSAKM